MTFAPETLKLMNAKRFAAFASLVTLAAFGVAPAFRPAVHAQQSSADRIVAERVLRLGGAVILDGQRTPISDLHELPDTTFAFTRSISSACRWARGDCGTSCSAGRRCRT